MEIVTPTSDFDFKTMVLGDPYPLAGQAGFYFTELSMGPEENKKSLCLQLPSCVTKQGVVSIKNAKYTDLMFERAAHDKLMQWIEGLEYSCQDIIDSKKELWFQTDLTRDDIETMMTQMTRLYQSGKYMLMRVFIETTKNTNKCIAYDENEIGFDLDTLEGNKTIIPLVMIEGVKFSSRSFEISTKLLQVMLIDKTEKKSTCLIKRPALEKPNVKNPERKTVTIANTTPTEILASKPLQKVTPVVAKPIAPVVAPNVAPVVAKPRPNVAPLVAKPIAPNVAPVVAKPRPNVAPLIAKPIAPNVAPNVAKSVAPNVAKSVAPNVVPNVVPNVALATAPATLIAKKKPILADSNLEEIDINYTNINETISLKKPNEVYYKIYREAREKAKQYRQKTLDAYLEAKQIKSMYMLDNIDDSAESDEETI